MCLKRALITCATMVAILSASARAQNPTFEVAVIKPAPSMAEALPLLQQGKLKAGISVDKARVDLAFVTLTDLIVEAFKIKPHQIAGPDWLPMERFDIQAKVPEGAAADQVPQMLRTMLAERFGLRVHTETRMLSAYALIVGKNGPRLPASVLPADPESPQGLATMTRSAGGKLNSNGGPAGPTQITMGPNGLQLVMLKAKISGLAELLTSILGKPVIDRSNLTGDYQIALDIPQSDVQNVARALGIGGPVGATGTPSDPGGSSMFQAVEQYGLRLDSRKEQIEILVVDHIDKLPTAN